MVEGAGQRALNPDEQVAASEIGSSRGVGMADVPLGPWAGAVVEAGVRKSGRVWHADPDCPQRPARVETTSYRQPDTGSLQDLVLPEALHCNPPGDLGAYRRAADRLLEYDAETTGANERLALGDLSLGLLDEQLQHGDNDLEAVLASGQLASVWTVVQQRRNQLLAALRDRADPGSERLAVMVLADWVRSGRTRREHQPRYTDFLELGVKCFERYRITYGGADRQVLNTWLPDWLLEVSGGTAPANATARLVGQVVGSADVHFRSDVPETVNRKVWTSIGRAWESLLAKLAKEYPGSIIAVFHQFGGPSSLWRVLPHASIEVGQLDWAVARVPTAMRPILRELDRGFVGLELAQQRTETFDTDRCVLLLRNLLVAAGLGRLVDRVLAGGRGGNTSAPEAGEGDDLAATVEWWQVGFGSELDGGEPRRKQFQPAIEAALENRTLDPPEPPRPRLSRRR